MSKKRERRSTNLDKGLAEIIDKLSEQENRSFTRQIHTLLQEAIAKRAGEKEPPFERVEQGLRQLSVIELSRMVRLGASLLEQKLSRSTELESDSELVKLVKQNYEVCSEVFEDSPEVLEHILAGGKPPSEAEPLLTSCIPLPPEQVIQLIRQEYGNGEAGSNYQGCNGGSSL